MTDRKPLESIHDALEERKKRRAGAAKRRAAEVAAKVDSRGAGPVARGVLRAQGGEAMRLWPQKRARIRVVYKSGAVIDLTCKSFTVRKAGAELRSVEWDSPRPSPLHFGVDDVAAVWER